MAISLNTAVMSADTVNFQEGKKASTSAQSNPAESILSALKKTFAKVFENDYHKVDRIFQSFSDRYVELIALPDNAERRNIAQQILNAVDACNIDPTFMRVFRKNPPQGIRCQELRWKLQKLT